MKTWHLLLRFSALVPVVVLSIAVAAGPPVITPEQIEADWLRQDVRPVRRF